MPRTSGGTVAQTAVEGGRVGPVGTTRHRPAVIPVSPQPDGPRVPPRVSGSPWAGAGRCGCAACVLCRIPRKQPLAAARGASAGLPASATSGDPRTQKHADRGIELLLHRFPGACGILLCDGGGDAAVAPDVFRPVLDRGAAAPADAPGLARDHPERPGGSRRYRSGDRCECRAEAGHASGNCPSRSR